MAVGARYENNKEGRLSMRKVFLTFGDGGQNFIDARERIAQEASRTRQFDEILVYGWKDVVAKGVLSSPLRRFVRGCGYWIWKPEIIFSVLSRLDDGDILVYCDCGDVLFNTSRQWRIFFRMLNRVDIICKRISACNLNRCRKEMLEAFGGGTEICGRMCFQFETGTLFFRKSVFSVTLVKEWMNTMVRHPEIVPDVISEAEKSRQLPSFVENRYEQSILTMLIYKCFSEVQNRSKVKSVWEFHAGWWVFGRPCIETARLRDGGVYKDGVKKRVVRICYRVLWRLQQFLERRGVCLFWEKRGWYGA